MRIALDCDGVLSDFVGSALKILNDVEDGWTREQITAFDIENLLTDDKANEFLDHLGWEIEEMRFVGNMQVLPGAKEFVDTLAQRFELCIATAPYPGVTRWVPEREEWLNRHFPGIPIVFTKHKEWVDASLLIDDNRSNCCRFVDNNCDRNALLMDAPYNQGTVALGVWRMKGYNQALEVVRGL